MTPSELYDLVFLEGTEQSPVALKIAPENYTSLRVQLHKYHKAMSASGLTTSSLCASFDASTETAKFWIGERRIRRGIPFTLIETPQDGTQI